MIAVKASAGVNDTRNSEISRNHGDEMMEQERTSGISPAEGGPFYNYTTYTHASAPFYNRFDDQLECMFSQYPWTKETLIDFDWAHPGSRWP